MFIYFVEQLWISDDPLMDCAKRNFITADMTSDYWHRYNYGDVKMPPSYDSRDHLVEGVDYVDY